MSISRESLQTELSAHAHTRDQHLANANALQQQRTNEIAQANAAEGARGAVARLLALCEEVPAVPDVPETSKAVLNGKSASQKPAAPVEA